MSECSHEPQYCWCEADSWAFREGERLREALTLIAQHARLDHAERGLAECERYAVIAESALSAGKRTVQKPTEDEGA